MTRTEPSELAKRLLKGMQEAATREVKKHLAAGRPVSGYRDGKLITIYPEGHPDAPKKEPA